MEQKKKKKETEAMDMTFLGSTEGEISSYPMGTRGSLPEGKVAGS
jgi:hypothetical protein